MDDALHYYDLGFSEIFIYQNYVVSKIKEGEAILLKHNVAYGKVIRDHFTDRNLVLISNRQHSFSIDPLLYKEVVKLPNLKGIAVVTYDSTKLKSALFEKIFASIPFEIFDSVDEAVVWANDVVASHKTSN
ncbi:MAG: hypothetical protein NWQ09_01610 [Nonlabens sp.]|nr:hypothetical protein [Nonlabens sp.]MDP5099996.1 hypothetical protein [Nonlabens sp.]